MQLIGRIVTIAVVALPISVIGLSTNSSAHVPITQSVSINGVEVYGQNAGTPDGCQDLPRKGGSAVQVCGTNTKVTVFLRNRCEKYYQYQQFVGSCNTGQSSSTCETATDAWLEHAQSYTVEAC